MKEKLVILEQQVSTYHPLLVDKENKLRDWDEKTLGTREIFEVPKTAICNNVLLRLIKCAIGYYTGGIYI